MPTVKGREVKGPLPKPFWLGVDPGASGGVALLSPSGEVLALLAMPDSHTGLWYTLSKLVGNYSAGRVRVCLELVGGYVGGAGNPGSAMFRFGQGYGGIEMALVALDLYPFLNPTPQKWQRALGIGVRDKDESKTEYKRRLYVRAATLYPDVEGLTLKTCDALLLAHYASLQ